MLDFQQLVSDLSEDRLLPAVPAKPDRVDILRTTERFFREMEDRRIYPKELSSPLGCQLELTHKCNLRCKQCYNSSGSPQKDIPFKAWMDVARQLVDMDVFECVISGGEPLLLGDKLYKLMDFLQDSGMRFVLVTNGMLLDEKAIGKLSRYDYYWLQVSIDGSKPQIHDSIRGVEGSWKKAVNAAKLVSQAGLPLVISHVLQKENIDYIDEMIQTSYVLGAKRMITGKFSLSGRAIENRNDIEVEKSKLDKAFKLLKVRHDQYTGSMEIVTSTDPAFYLRYRILEPCNVLLIRPNGDVKLDCVLPFKIGNVLNSSISDMWNCVGKSAWRNPQVIDYIKAIKQESDMLSVRPRPYIDEDVLIG
ncbi:MAG: radical SAM protein [Candidatus Aenigmarchaeota archaeon]|nr:radical SAM protein [Candidatus Aenigmarchaeota archaeon]